MKSIPQLPAGFTPHWNGPYELTVHVQNVKAPHSRDYVTGWDSTKIGPDGRISHGGSNM